MLDSNTDDSISCLCCIASELMFLCNQTKTIIMCHMAVRRYLHIPYHLTPLFAPGCKVIWLDRFYFAFNLILFFLIGSYLIQLDFSCYEFSVSRQSVSGNTSCGQASFRFRGVSQITYSVSTNFLCWPGGMPGNSAVPGRCHKQGASWDPGVCHPGLSLFLPKWFF